MCPGMISQPMYDAIPSTDGTLIDLSIGLEDGVPSEPTPPQIDAFDHEEGAGRLAATPRVQGYDIEASDFPDGQGLAWVDLAVIPTPERTSTHPPTTVPKPTANRRRRSMKSRWNGVAAPQSSSTSGGKRRAAESPSTRSTPHSLNWITTSRRANSSCSRPAQMNAGAAPSTSPSSPA